MATKYLCFVSALFSLYTSAWCQFSLQACCDMRMMDSTNQVVIDTKTVLTPGRYRALSARFCTTETVYIQIWTRINDDTYALKVQVARTVSDRENAPVMVTVNLDAFTITPTDRLGMFIESDFSEWMKFPVPYSHDDINGGLRRSSQTYNDATALSIGDNVTLEPGFLPASLEGMILLCADSDCSDLTNDVPDIVPPRPTTPTVCGCQTTCQPDGLLSDSLDQTSNSVTELIKQVNEARDILDGLLSSSIETGYCPPGYVSSPYGIGSCFVLIKDEVGIGEAKLRCAKTWNSSLVQIDSSIEESYLYQLIASNNEVVKIWTSAIYNQILQIWEWDRSNSIYPIKLQPDDYQNWGSPTTKTPPSTGEYCMVLIITPSNSSSHWDFELCNGVDQNYYYVCELAKRCY